MASGQESSQNNNKKGRKPKKERPDPFFERVPPQNLEAERSVLGSVLLSNDVIDDIVETLQPAYFYDDAHRKVYTAIHHMFSEGARAIDAITLAEELSRRGELEAVGGVNTLLELLESVPHAAHAKYYANIVRDKYVQRTLIYACNDILGDCYEGSDPTEEILTRAEQSIFGILESQETADKFEIRDILMDTWDRINERLQSDDEVSGLSTGYPDMDRVSTGFQPTELVILAARPSMGKTAFVCNLALNIARQQSKPGQTKKCGVLIFSLEQSKLELAERFLCIHSAINGHNLRSGMLEPEEQSRLLQASSELSEMPLFLDDRPGRSMSQIAAIARRLERKHGNLGMVIIDYLQLVEPEDKHVPREQQIASISRRLKFLAKELDIPVIALAQLNRGVELREDKRPRLADLRESGAIEQDADMVMFLHRPEQYDPQDRPGLAEVIIAKHRSGPTGIVSLTWRKDFMRFENYSNLNEPDGGYFGGESGF